MKHNLNPEQLLMLCKGETVEIDGKKIHITEVTSDVAPKPKPTIKPVWEKYPTWESLKSVEGFYVSGNSDVLDIKTKSTESNINTFRTEAQCKFALAAAQLSQLVHKWNEECGEEWGEEVYCISYDTVLKSIIVLDYNRKFVIEVNLLVAFKTQHLAEKFIELNTPLLKDFFMLND